MPTGKSKNLLPPDDEVMYLTRGKMNKILPRIQKISKEENLSHNSPSNRENDPPTDSRPKLPSSDLEKQRKRASIWGYPPGSKWKSEKYGEGKIMRVARGKLEVKFACGSKKFSTTQAKALISLEMVTKSLKMRIRTRINPTQSRTARFTPSPASSQSSKGSGSGKSRKGDRKGIEVGSKEEGDTPWTKQQMDAIKWGFKPDNKYISDEFGEVVVKYVKKGRLYITLLPGMSMKYITKKEAQGLRTWEAPKMLTRRMRKANKIETNKKKRKASSTKSQPKQKRRRTLWEELRPRRQTRSTSSPEKDSQMNSYGYMREMARGLEGLKRGTSQTFVADIKMCGKFSAYSLGHGVEVRRTTIPGTHPRNRGLFATVRIERNKLITEYSGKKINRETAMKLRKDGKATHVKGLNYDFFLDGNRWPCTGEGAAQMANDGRDLFENNAKFVIKYDIAAGGDRCFLKALRDIEVGEEIFVSYGNWFWKDLEDRDSNSD